MSPGGVQKCQKVIKSVTKVLKMADFSHFLVIYFREMFRKAGQKPLRNFVFSRIAKRGRFCL